MTNWLKKAFSELTPEATQRRYDKTYEKLMHAPPPPKKPYAPTYFLYYHVIHKHEGSATIHLHGIRTTPFSGQQKHIEYISLKFLPGETDAELIRCAVWMSPNKWRVPFGKNISQFAGKFYAPLDERLRSTLTDPSQISSAGNAL